MNVHLFTNFNGLLKRGMECFNGLREFLIRIVELGLCQQAITDLSITEILLCVFNLSLDFCKLFFEGLFNIHFKYFLNFITWDEWNLIYLKL